MRRRELEFVVSDKVFLKVSPLKSVMWFGRKRNLSPHFIGPYEIVRIIGKVAYELQLPAEISMVHPVFHISLLRFYKTNPFYILTHKEIKFNKGLSYEEEPMQILNHQVRRLRTKDLAYVKLLWRNHNCEEATWEAEEEIKKNYPHLFPISGCYLMLINKKTIMGQEQWITYLFDAAEGDLEKKKFGIASLIRCSDLIEKGGRGYGE
ncbi:uncharacterized protein LOC132607774 [Lycium barbarum]|uniref:uncharacterized protein LOC132607774 n=1 Tax=Lycium barbarum TaxID=112863 RepID=UPI00293E8A46|nr:uncharacterized protein LOC132607774 [Lycium barbarum]